jgi:ketosteroid isomerase-like protein
VAASHPNEELIAELYEARKRKDRARIREIFAEDIAWHDPYPPPHGGDLVGVEAVLRDVFDKAGELTGGSTTLELVQTFATDDHVAALVNWSSEYRGKRMEGREIAVYRVRDGRVTEAWFYPANQEAAWEFFA